MPDTITEREITVYRSLLEELIIRLVTENVAYADLVERKLVGWGIEIDSAQTWDEYRIMFTKVDDSQIEILLLAKLNK